MYYTPVLMYAHLIVLDSISVFVNKCSNELLFPLSVLSELVLINIIIAIVCVLFLQVQHCLEAVEKAKQSKFLDFKTFDLQEYVCQIDVTTHFKSVLPTAERTKSSAA